MERDAKEKGRLGRLKEKIEAKALQTLSKLLNAAVKGVSELEDGFDKTILNILKPLERILAENAEEYSSGSSLGSVIHSLHKQIQFLTIIVKEDTANQSMKLAENSLLNITGRLGSMIPVIPDPKFYVPGKWTAGRELDVVRTCKGRAV